MEGELLHISNAFGDAPVHFKRVTHSTMADARELATGQFRHGTVVAAGFQSGGRGRRPERSWHASPGESMLATILLRQEALTLGSQAVPLVAGLALSTMLENDYRISSRIKWPNDVLIGERKISGILCESFGRATLVGVGINCNQTDFPRGLAREPISIRQLVGKPVEVNKILESYLVALSACLRDATWAKEIEARLYGKGRRATVSGGVDGMDTLVEGTVLGIGSLGQLVFLTGDGTRDVYGGEVVFED